MDFSRHTELIEGVVNQLIDEEALGVCLEMHRAIKLGYYELLYPEDSVYEKQVIVEVRGLDIFGCSPQSLKKNIDCICPNCSRSLGALKFAPHLEKCMGMGRLSSRLAATKKQKPAVTVSTAGDSDQDGSEDNEDDWTYPEASRKSGGGGGGGGGGKKHRKDKLPISSSPHRSGRGPGRPPKQKERGGGGVVSDHAHNGEVHSSSGGFHSLKMHTVHSFKALSNDHKVRLLDQICGVVSERTGRLCTRSVNCPQHMEEQRLELRTILLKERRSLDHDVMPPPQKRSKSAHHSPVEDLDEEDSSGNGFKLRPISETALIRKKKKSSKKGKRGHITTATTVLHSSMF